MTMTDERKAERMTLTDARKTQLMAYCRIDELAEGEVVLLEGMYQGAIDYLNEAGVTVPPEGTGRRFQFDQIVNALVLDEWDNRGTQVAGTVMAANPAFRRRLNQLKQTEPVPDSDTGAGA